MALSRQAKTSPETTVADDGASVIPHGNSVVNHSDSAAGQGPLTGKRIWVLVGILFGMLLGSLDQTIVGTAMPRVISSLGGMDYYSWVFTAYMLASTTSVPVFGKLSDLFGRKWFYLGSLALFMAGSMACGAAQNMTQLIVFRGLQGLGGGSMMANAAAIIGDIFPPAERGRYQGLMGGVFGLSSVIGPTLGGYITDQLNWRWVFYVNLPVGVIALFILLWAMPRVRLTERRSVDYLGVSMLIAATVPMLLALSWAGTEYAWASPTIVGLLAFSALAWVALVLVERRAKEPILPVDLFTSNSIVSVSSIVVFLTGAGMFGAITFIPLFMQAVIGTSATNSGVMLTPMMLALVFSSMVGGQIISRTGKYKGVAVVALAILTFGMFLMSRMKEAATYGLVVRNMIVVGLGLGVTMPLFMITVQNSVPYSKLGIVTAAVQFFRSIGGTIGVAVFGTFLTSSMQRELATAIPAQLKAMVPADQLKGILDPQALINPAALAQARAHLSPALAPLFDQVMVGVRHAIAVSLHDVFWAGALAVAVSLVATFFLKEIPLRRSHHGAVR